MNESIQALAVYADGFRVSCGRAVLTGRDAVGLLPSLFLLRLWNVSDADAHFLAGAKSIAVYHQNSLLVSGEVSTACRRLTSSGSVTEVCFSAGLRLWEASVSLSIEAGVSVSESVKRILAASGTGIPLLSFPGSDPHFLRGQAYFGRAAECVRSALSAASARGYLVGAGLCVVPAEELPVSVRIGEEDLISAPFFPDREHAVLRVRLSGWPLGKRTAATWKGVETRGVIVERAINADTAEDMKSAELLMERARE